MPITTDDRPLVDQLRGRHAELVADLEKLLEDRKTARTSAVDARSALDTDEARTAHDETEHAAEEAFRAAFAAKERECDDVRAQITQEEEVAQRKADAAAHAPVIRVTHEPLTYRKDNQSDFSYWADLAANHSDKLAGAFRQRTNRDDSRARLTRHAQEMDVLSEERRKAREQRALKVVEEAMRSEGYRGDASPMWERRVNPSTQQGQGGYFTPPDWLVQDFIPYLRAGRTAADLCRRMPVPPGYSSVNIPKVTTPTLVQQQGANNVAVVSQDIADTSVATGFRTFAGQEDVAIQWLDFSPAHITDEVVTSDLMAAYNLNIDFNVVQGTGAANSTATSGGLAGLYPYTNWSATNVTCTQGSPTPANLYGTFGVQASQIAQARFELSNVHYLWHPRRGLWFATGLDGSSARPFVESSSFAPWNPGAVEAQSVAEGRLLQFPWGPDVYISKNVPTADNTNSAGGSADVSIAAKWDDVWLFEDEPRTRVLEEVLSGTLQVRFQIYNYAGLIVRYGGSVAIAAGTGFAGPTVNGGSF